MLNSKNKRAIFIGCSFLLLLLILFLIIKSLKEEVVFFYAPKDLITQTDFNKVKNKKIRVGGLVKKGSVQKINALKIRFTIEDQKGKIVIEYQGLTPDLFREGQGIIAIGRFKNDKKIFFADRLLVKHDEKYMPPEVAKSIQKQ